MSSHCLLGSWIWKIPRVSNTLNPMFWLTLQVFAYWLCLNEIKTESQKQADGKKNVRCQLCQVRVFQFRGAPNSKSIILQVIPCMKKSDVMPMLQDVHPQSCHFRNKLCSLSGLEDSTILLPCQPPPLHLQQHPGSASMNV